MKIGRWLREPLLHFLLAGGALFIITSFFESSSQDEKTIRIGRDDLLVFMQGRAQVYDQETFSSMLEAMPAEEKASLLRDAALQEALYRQGKTLNLAEADPLIRVRIIQQMRLLLAEDAASGAKVSDAEIEEYYKDNRDLYSLPETASFTHVFFRTEETGRDAFQLAQNELGTLRAEQVPFEDAGKYGERFLYQLNYIDVSRDVVASHFGDDFAERMFALNVGEWSGPLKSEHGWHLVLVSKHNPASKPALAEIVDRVREDALAEKRSELAQGALDGLLSQYNVVDATGSGP